MSKLSVTGIKGSTLTSNAVIGVKATSNGARVLKPRASYIKGYKSSKSREVAVGSNQEDTLVLAILTDDTEERASKKKLIIHNPYTLNLLRDDSDNGHGKAVILLRDFNTDKLYLVVDEAGLVTQISTTRAKVPEFHKYSKFINQYNREFDLSKVNEFLFDINTTEEEFTFVGDDNEFSTVKGYELTYKENLLEANELYNAYVEKRDVDTTITGIVANQTKVDGVVTKEEVSEIDETEEVEENKEKVEVVVEADEDIFA